MLATTHALTGALLGRRMRSVPAAFAVGVASHFALDVLPHWGLPDRRKHARDKRIFWLFAVPDGLLMAGVVAWLARTEDPATVACSVGAVAPDLNKPAEIVGLTLWGEPIDRWHNDIQRLEGRRRWPVDVGVAVGSWLVLLASRSGWGSVLHRPKLMLAKRM